MNVLERFEKNSDLNKSIIITLPSNIEWSEYQKELDKVRDRSEVLNFKVPVLPKKTKVGNKCYLTHKGFVLGWMEIVGLENKSFTCSTTGKEWDGNFILRSGEFHYLKNQVPYKGFQGFRYFDDEGIE